MVKIKYIRPKLVVRNISEKDVRVLGLATISPRTKFDLFTATEPTELFEDAIIKALEKPWGDLYREVEVKKSLVIEELELSSFYYNIISPSDLKSINSYVPGNVPKVFDDDRFEWISGAVEVSHPLEIDSNIITIPRADLFTDGYLSKEDFAIFSAKSARLPIKIWQYQDFPTPVSSTLSLTDFENGTGLPFDENLIIDGTATIVLTADTETPPTTTLSIPGRWLPANRVVVSSHIGSTVILNQSPDITLGCRVYFLVGVPLGTALPENYQEAPQFIRKQRAEFIDAGYVNIEGDENISGIKTFNDAINVLGLTTTETIRITTSPSTGFSLISDSLGNGEWKKNPTVSATAPPTPYHGQIWIDSSDYDTYMLDGIRSKWLSIRTIRYSASRERDRVSNMYLYADGIPTSATPIVLPYDATLIAMTASGRAVQTWSAEVRIASTTIAGTTINVLSDLQAIDLTKNVNFSSGDRLKIFLNGTDIRMPKIDVIFARRK